MKKIKLLLLILLIGFSSFGCFKRDKYQDIKIYTTAYPIEYILNYLYGDNAEIETIYPSGIDIKTFELNAKLIKDYSKADMFVYNELSKEKNIAANLINQNKKIDTIPVAKGLDIENDITELWLSPTNFLMLASNIKNSLKEYITDANLINQIDDNYEKLKIEISEIDAELKIIAENANNNKLIVANNSLKFLQNYGFEVISIVDNENSNTNKSQAEKLITNNELTNIYIISGYEETEDINELIKAGATLVEIPSLYTISEEQRKNDYDYMYFIKNFIENIKTEVYCRNVNDVRPLF